MQINAENNNLYGPIADGAFAVCIILLTKPAISINSVNELESDKVKGGRESGNRKYIIVIEPILPRNNFV